MDDGWRTWGNMDSAPPSYLVAWLMFGNRDFRDGEVRDAGRGLGSLSLQCERQSLVSGRRVRNWGGVPPTQGTHPHLGDPDWTRTGWRLQPSFTGLLQRLKLILLLRLLCGPVYLGLAWQTDLGQVNCGQRCDYSAGPSPILSLRTDSTSEKCCIGRTRRSSTEVVKEVL